MAHLLDGKHVNVSRLLSDAAPTESSVVAVQQPHFRDQRGLDYPAMEHMDNAALGEEAVSVEAARVAGVLPTAGPVALPVHRT